MKYLKKSVKKSKDFVKGQDAFGTPITVNYKGEDTYKSCFGGLCSLCIFAIVMFQFYNGLVRMIDRDNPDMGQYFVPKSRNPDNPLDVPALGGQIYIGLKQVDRLNGNYEFISFNNSFIDTEVNYFTNGQLEDEILIPACDDLEDFKGKVQYTPELKESDFAKMKCFPAQNFSLYSNAQENLFNQISVVVNQCGGKLSEQKETELVDTEGLDSASAELDNALASLDDDALGDLDLSAFGLGRRLKGHKERRQRQKRRLQQVSDEIAQLFTAIGVTDQTAIDVLSADFAQKWPLVLLEPQVNDVLLSLMSTPDQTVLSIAIQDTVSKYFDADTIDFLQSIDIEIYSLSTSDQASISQSVQTLGLTQTILEPDTRDYLVSLGANAQILDAQIASSAAQSQEATEESDDESSTQDVADDTVDSETSTEDSTEGTENTENNDDGAADSTEGSQDTINDESNAGGSTDVTDNTVNDESTPTDPSDQFGIILSPEVIDFLFSIELDVTTLSDIDQLQINQFAEQFGLPDVILQDGVRDYLVGLGASADIIDQQIASLTLPVINDATDVDDTNQSDVTTLPDDTTDSTATITDEKSIGETTGDDDTPISGDIGILSPETSGFLQSIGIETASINFNDQLQIQDLVQQYGLPDFILEFGVREELLRLGAKADLLAQEIDNLISAGGSDSPAEVSDETNVSTDATASDDEENFAILTQESRVFLVSLGIDLSSVSESEQEQIQQTIDTYGIPDVLLVPGFRNAFLNIGADPILLDQKIAEISGSPEDSNATDESDSDQSENASESASDAGSEIELDSELVDLLSKIDIDALSLSEDDKYSIKNAVDAYGLPDVLYQDGIRQYLMDLGANQQKLDDYIACPSQDCEEDSNDVPVDESGVNDESIFLSDQDFDYIADSLELSYSESTISTLTDDEIYNYLITLNQSNSRFQGQSFEEIRQYYLSLQNGSDSDVAGPPDSNEGSDIAEPPNTEEEVNTGDSLTNDGSAGATDIDGIDTSGLDGLDLGGLDLGDLDLGGTDFEGTDLSDLDLGDSDPSDLTGSPDGQDVTDPSTFDPTSSIDDPISGRDPDGFDPSSFTGNDGQSTSTKDQESSTEAVESSEESPTDKKGYSLDNESKCESTTKLRNYLRDKVLVVYVSSSYVAQENQEPNKNELITYLTPIVEKNLDFSNAKIVNAQIQEISMDIQDSYWQIFQPAKQSLSWTKTYVYNEDVVEREYLKLPEEEDEPAEPASDEPFDPLNFDTSSLSADAAPTEFEVDPKLPIAQVNFKLDTTLTVQERTVYDSLALFGDIGGLNDFIYWVITPIMGYILGDRFGFSLIKNLFWQNNTKKQKKRKDEVTSPQVEDESSQLKKGQEWSKSTTKIKIGWWDQVKMNPIVKLITCKMFRKKNTLEKAIDIGQDRVDRQLDIRSLIISQNVLMSLTRVLLKDKKARQLLKLQRRHKVVEPGISSESSSDNEEDLTVGAKKELKHFEDYSKVIEGMQEDPEFMADRMDEDMVNLLRGMVLLERSKKPKKSVHADNLSDRGNGSSTLIMQGFYTGAEADASRVHLGLDGPSQIEPSMPDAVLDVDGYDDFGKTERVDKIRLSVRDEPIAKQEFNEGGSEMHDHQEKVKSPFEIEM